MTADDIKRWLAQHGDAKGDPEVSAQGDTTYRANDGAYVTVHKDGSLAGQGYAGGGDAAASGSGDTPGSDTAPATTGGKGLSQDEVMAALAQMAPGNNPGRLAYTETTAQRTVTTKDPADTLGVHPATTKTVTVPVRIWYDPASGQAVKYDVNADGTFSQTFNGVDKSLIGPAATTATEAAGGPTLTPGQQAVSDNEAELQRQRVKNAALPKDQDPAYETDEDRRKRAEATIKQQGADATAADARARQQKIDEQNAATAAAASRRADSAEARAVAEANKVGSKVTENTINGQHYTTIVTTSPDGKTSKIEHYGPDGTLMTTPLPTEGVGNIKGLPNYTPDLTKPGGGLFEYGKALDEYMAAHPDFTWEKRQTVMAAAQAQATQVASEFNTSATILREKYQTDVTQRGQDMTQSNSRATLADDHYKNAMGMIEKFGPYLGANSGKLFMGMMASQLATATAYGGMANTPRAEMDPRLAQYANQHISGPSQPGAPTPPNALGLGAIGNQPAPGTPGAALGAVLPSATGALPSPLLPPPPPVTGSVAAPGTPPAAPGPTPPLDQGQDSSTPPPAAGAPGGPPVFADPNTGQFAIPGSFSTGPTQPAAPPAGDTGAPPISMAPPPSPSVANLFSSVLPDPMTSWRQDAQQRADAMTPANPGAVATGERLFGSALPTAPMQFGGPGTFSLGQPMPQAPMALQSQIPGMTPELDAEARRQLQAEGVMV